MMLRNDIESGFDVCDQRLTIFDFDEELVFKGIVNMDASHDINGAISVTEVGVVGNRNVLPARRVDLTEPSSYAVDDSAKSNSWLLSLRC